MNKYLQQRFQGQFPRRHSPRNLLQAMVPTRNVEAGTQARRRDWVHLVIHDTYIST